jgi:hypothetical protein
VRVDEIGQCRDRVAIASELGAAERGVPVGERVTWLGGAQEIADGGEKEQSTLLGRRRREQWLA